MHAYHKCVYHYSKRSSSSLLWSELLNGLSFRKPYKLHTLYVCTLLYICYPFPLKEYEHCNPYIRTITHTYTHIVRSSRERNERCWSQIRSGSLVEFSGEKLFSVPLLFLVLLFFLRFVFLFQTIFPIMCQWVSVLAEEARVRRKFWNVALVQMRARELNVCQFNWLQLSSQSTLLYTIVYLST